MLWLQLALEAVVMVAVTLGLIYGLSYLFQKFIDDDLR